MIIPKFLLREAFKSQLAVFAVLLVIFVSRELVSILSKAVEGKFAGDILFQLVLLNLPKLIIWIIPISFFLGILFAFGRMYADSEMVVLRACGISEWYVTRVALILSVLTMLVCGGISFYLNPWAQGQEDKLLDEADASTNISLLAEGRFRATPDDSAVVFVEKIAQKGKELGNIFIARMPDTWGPEQRANIVLAKQGTVVQKANGDALVTLYDGHRYEGAPTELDYQVLDFKKYQVPVTVTGPEPGHLKLDAKPTSQLLLPLDQAAITELHWRLAIPIAIPILALIAVPLASVNPRQGKFAKLLPAIMLYLGYFVLLMTGRKALQDGDVPVWLGLWWVHLSGLAIGAAMVLNGRPFGVRLRAILSRRSS